MIKTLMFKRLIFVLYLFLLPLMAKAELTVEIVGGAAQQIPIAIVPFSTPPAPGTALPRIPIMLKPLY